mmetsp:Transcript_13359/g.16624  ORF Transcript_13359/g.16624 Transcript_13359/m.16624 type:complete len:121 (-) Transcript_13359:345-707(-)|eukprot:CAMPEP_0204894714 /NCGR_PEP_ID=MMETSP1349-20130617/33574_1 /ASSEMBLY_ACC=CAM_ASM_000710 /TAXON_ID=215587 /ORGANISM="Aplanochytrium stocchinoi, Strain GSBS06" /LENGTH=120 /DNA_ID=CAMNT_0052061913 /DNA_START=154 /DNA_END=516 /DNA_ORIENTATION=-
MDFAAEFVPLIWEEKKTATTRFLKEESMSVGQLAETGTGTKFEATCSENGGVGFALLEITNFETKNFGDLDLELAKIENFSSSEELKQTLRRFYPTIQDSDTVHVFHFKLLHAVYYTRKC